MIGCVYIYPAQDPAHEAEIQSWVRASHAELDSPLANALAEWLTEGWPWQRVDRFGR